MKHERQRRFRILRTYRCVCGLRWPCPDNLGWSAGEPIPDGPMRDPTSRQPAWTDSTVADLQARVGRTGRLTSGQRHRANGGR